jgi:hypothetical protein
MRLKNTKDEKTSYQRDSNGRLILFLDECNKIRDELIEQDKRAAFMGHLYRVFGRNNPDHPKHGFYTGLWEEFCLEEAGYVVREMFFERLEAVRLYEEEQQKKNSNVYTNSHPESDSNAVATRESATA